MSEIGKFDGESGDIMSFAALDWKDYLKKKNYNRDITEMCTLCRDKQIAEHGKITIKCNGLASSDSVIPPDQKHMFDQSELDLIEMLANPYYWAEKEIDPNNPNPDNRLFAKRWYQEQISRCTANRKAIRCGRRAGKSYSLALNMLHRAMMNKDYFILIVTPFEVQAEEIITLVLQFARNLGPTFGSYDEIIKSYKQSPNHTIHFQNGSRIKAFTAGANGAGSVRGQKAHLIVLDEVDYLDQKDFNAILAILADRPTTELWASSTPDGEKQLSRLSKDPRYKEFHFPSFVIPHYNDELDSEFRSGSDELGYVQEIMAEFGASKMGVFQKYYVDLCTNIQYKVTVDEVMADRSKYILIMGCDWNHDKIGTRIVVLAFDTVARMFFILEKAQVSKEGWSQIMAMNRIMDMNRKYIFDYIYVDEGFGSTQIQMMKKHAYDNFGRLPSNHPDLKLAEINAINFSSTFEINDPFTGKPIKKHMKPYMVNNLVKLIERGMLKIDPVADKAIVEQMKGYEEKRSPSGKPVYQAANEQIGDHDLDALMLAALGFNFQFSELFDSGDLSITIVSHHEMYGNIVQDKQQVAVVDRSVMAAESDVIMVPRRGLKPTNRTSDLLNGSKRQYNDWSRESEGTLIPASGQNLLNRTTSRRASFR